MLDTKFSLSYDNQLALFIVYAKWTECILWLQGIRDQHNISCCGE